MTSVNDLHPDQLRSLLHFYADAGVEWLLEETPVDRIAEMQALKAAQGERRVVEQAPAAPERENRPAPSRPVLPAAIFATARAGWSSPTATNGRRSW